MIIPAGNKRKGKHLFAQKCQVKRPVDSSVQQDSYLCRRDRWTPLPPASEREGGREAPGLRGEERGAHAMLPMQNAPGAGGMLPGESTGLG